MEKELLAFYIVLCYLFDFGALTVKNGSNWWNFIFAPIFVPIKLGRILAIKAAN